MLKVQEIREIIKLIDNSSIDEFTYETNGTTVSMKKSNGNDGERPSQVQENPTGTIEQTQISREEPLVKTVEKAPEKEEILPKQESNLTYDYEIVSPMVGTFYIAPSPESDPFVLKGSKVEKTSVVCIVEAMKLFNEIEAEVSGEIVEILVEDGELVEYGQPLFRVNTK